MTLVLIILFQILHWSQKLFLSNATGKDMNFESYANVVIQKQSLSR